MGRHRTTPFLLLFLLAFAVHGDRVRRQETDPEAPAEPPAEAPAEPPAEAPASEPEAPAEPAEKHAEETPAPASDPEVPLEPTPDNTATMESGPAKVESTTPKEWIEEAIKKHNEYRALHGVGPLIYNETLCQISQAYANHLAETHEVVHNPALQSAKLGENLYYDSNSFPKPLNADVPVKAWYDEIHDYDFKTGYPFNDSKEILHFTQLVWKGTTDVGIALAKSVKPNGMHANYVVANYSPRGNFDDFLTNVLPTVGGTVEKEAEKPGSGDAESAPVPKESDASGKAKAPVASGCMRHLLGGGAILVVILAGLLSFLYYDRLNI